VKADGDEQAFVRRMKVGIAFDHAVRDGLDQDVGCVFCG
jgi:hypothetical protein